MREYRSAKPIKSRNFKNTSLRVLLERHDGFIGCAIA
jgi:hypothetical protein